MRPQCDHGLVKPFSEENSINIAGKQDDHFYTITNIHNKNRSSKQYAKRKRHVYHKAVSKFLIYTPLARLCSVRRGPGPFALPRVSGTVNWYKMARGKKRDHQTATDQPVVRFAFCGLWVGALAHLYDFTWILSSTILISDFAGLAKHHQEVGRCDIVSALLPGEVEWNAICPLGDIDRAEQVFTVLLHAPRKEGTENPPRFKKEAAARGIDVVIYLAQGIACIPAGEGAIERFAEHPVRLRRGWISYFAGMVIPKEPCKIRVARPDRPDRQIGEKIILYKLMSLRPSNPAPTEFTRVFREDRPVHAYSATENRIWVDVAISEGTPWEQFYESIQEVAKEMNFNIAFWRESAASSADNKRMSFILGSSRKPDMKKLIPRLRRTLGASTIIGHQHIFDDLTAHKVKAKNLARVADFVENKLDNHGVAPANSSTCLLDAAGLAWTILEDRVIAYNKVNPQANIRVSRLVNGAEVMGRREVVEDPRKDPVAVGITGLPSHLGSAGIMGFPPLIAASVGVNEPVRATSVCSKKRVS